MQVGPNTLVTMEYTLRLDSGEAVASSEGKEPLNFAYGQEQIIPGLERGLAGLQPGEQKEIRVEAEEAYGPRRPDAVTVVGVQAGNGEERRIIIPGEA
jgi:FKBP-type peptidyl-prolyl cis-trans isomerase 2